jgi:hypothetical protein
LLKVFKALLFVLIGENSRRLGIDCYECEAAQRYSSAERGDIRGYFGTEPIIVVEPVNCWSLVAICGQELSNRHVLNFDEIVWAVKGRSEMSRRIALKADHCVDAQKAMQQVKVIKLVATHSDIPAI